MNREWRGNELLEDGISIGRVYEYEGEWIGQCNGNYLFAWHQTAVAARDAIDAGEFEGCEGD